MKTKQIAHFELLELLGQGGMGTVHKARDREHDRFVALKVLTAGLLADEEVKRRFHREAFVGKQLNHPNIVEVFEIGEESGHCYISMEYVDGQNLRQCIEEKPLTPHQCIQIGIDVCDALKTAHQNGIIHRDLKSANIMISPQGNVKIMDFGIAKFQGASLLTQEGNILGTAAYMSPEQALGEAIDTRSDIFSLGIILFESLTGQLPFCESYELATIYAIVNEAPLELKEFNLNIPDMLEQIVLKALEKEVQNRYQDVESFANDLKQAQDILDGHEVVTTMSELVAAERSGQIKSTGAHFTQAVRRGFQARFSGRDDQFELLKSELSGSVHGVGRTVFISGEAGIGKSRLAQELEKYARTLKIKTMTGRCQARHGQLPYLPIVEAIRHFFGIQSQANIQQLEEFIENHATDLMPKLPAIRVFLNMHSYEGSIIESQDQIWDAVFQLFIMISRQRPFVLFLDDLHWADENTIQLLRYLSRNISTSRILIIGTYRPLELHPAGKGLTHPLSDLENELRREEKLTVIPLTRLDIAAVKQMVFSLFHDADFEHDFYDSLFNETEGNPFFVLETLKLLKMEGVIQKDHSGYCLKEDYKRFGIPNSIHDIVMRRIEKLSSEEHEILEIGAVEGEAFFSDTICNALEIDRLKLLRKLQSLERDHHIIHPKEKMYFFDHSKIREFLYEAITPELRIAYHQNIGEYLSRTYGNDSHFVSRIAHHFVEGEEEEKALPFLVTAGDNAKILFANQQALDFYRQAFAIIRSVEMGNSSDILTRQKLSVIEGLGDVLSLIGKHDAALENYRILEKMLDDLSPQLVELYWKMGAVFLTKGENEKALEFLDQAETHYEKNLERMKAGETVFKSNREPCPEKDLLTLLGRIKFSKARVYKASGAYPRAIEEIEDGLTILEDEGNYKEKAQAYNDLGNILFDQGDYPQSSSMHSKSLEMRKKIEDKKGIAETFINLANIECEEGHYVQAAQLLEESNRIMTEIGHRYGMAGTFVNLGIVYNNLGRYEDAIRAHQKSLEISAEIGSGPVQILSYSNLGADFNDLQDYEKAKNYLEKGMSLMDELDSKVFESQAQIWLAQTYLGLGQLSEAKVMVEKARTNAEKLNQKAYQGLAKRLSGSIEMKQLVREQAEENQKKEIEKTFTESLKLFESLKMEHEAGRCCLELARYYQWLGNHFLFQDYADRANVVFQKMGAKGDIQKVLDLLAEQ